MSLTGDDAAIQIVRQLSDAAAQSGLDTALFVPPSRQPLDGLRVPPTGSHGATQDNPTIHELHRTLDDAAPDADLAIVLVITDGSKLELPRWSASMPTVMSVSAGFARRDELAIVSAMMRAASRPFAGVIVTNPDPRDGTSASQLPTTEPAARSDAHHRRGAEVGVVRRRFKDEGPAVEHDNASDEDPTPTTIVPAQNGRSTNGHGAPTLVEHVGDDIVVWPAPDEDAWASNGSSAASRSSPHRRVGGR